MFFRGCSKERSEPGHGARDSPETVLFDEAVAFRMKGSLAPRVRDTRRARNVYSCSIVLPASRACTCLSQSHQPSKNFLAA